MHDRTALGNADITDAQLALIVADSLGVERVDLLCSRADVAPYDLEALTTASRHWVRGRAKHSGGEEEFAIFVKVIQSFARSAMFAFVPEDLRAEALCMVPWEAEARVYLSDLGDRLPSGLSMPRALAVVDIDAVSAALWLEGVDVDDRSWTDPEFGTAAYLLGRLAASVLVRPLACLADRGMASVRGYVGGRVAHEVIPALRDASTWSHPLVQPWFDDRLRRDLLGVVDHLPALLDELETLRLGTAHGDACPRNLLRARGREGLVLIDFGFWGEAPLGFDLTQLLVGEVQLDERSASCLPALEALCLREYVRGLSAEGTVVPERHVRRAHAICMMIFAGLSAIPFENLRSAPDQRLHAISRTRAQSVRFMLDLLASTNPS